MKKIVMFMLLLIPILARADAGDDLADMYFSKKTLQLTAQEKKAIEIGRKWQTGRDTSKPFVGGDGAINYIFGAGQVQVVCAVLQVCDVALQPGEFVNNLNVGDPRFEVEPGITNVGAYQQVHLLIKPKDVGLDSTLVVTTSKRAYHFRLRSTRQKSMPYISFTYPDDAQAKWDAIRTKQLLVRQENTLPQTNEYLGNLNFNYRISGSARWKPSRVYNDGVKTIIEMPAAMRQSEAPTLLVLRDRGFFRKDETVMVNYRVQNGRFIVDSVFDKAIMIVGVGRSQDKVTIVRCK